jgi:hypothetical protein
MAGEPRAGGTIFLARGIHCCPNFLKFLLRAQRLYTVKNMCIYTYKHLVLDFTLYAFLSVLVYTLYILLSVLDYTLYPSISVLGYALKPCSKEPPHYAMYCTVQV